MQGVMRQGQKAIHTCPSMNPCTGRLTRVFSVALIAFAGMANFSWRSGIGQLATTSRIMTPTHGAKITLKELRTCVTWPRYASMRCDAASGGAQRERDL